MTKKEFIMALGKELSGLPREEQDKWLDFYGEMIADRMEEGLPEAEAVEAVGSVEAVARQILSQSQAEPLQMPEQPSQPEKVPRKTWQTVLLIAGSPVWLSLLIAAAAVALAAFISAWSVIIVLYAVAGSLIACGFGGLVALPIFIYNGNVASGLFCLGAGLFCAGVGIAMFVGTSYLIKRVGRLCKKLFHKSEKEARIYISKINIEL